MAKSSFNKFKGHGLTKSDEWDLNDVATQAEPFFALSSDTDFSALWGEIKFAGAEYECGTATKTVASGAALFDTYGYVFLSPNGGKAETILGDTDLSGIIASGIGDDTVTGGDLADLIFLGTGADIADGGGGDDIAYGENGADELTGNLGNDLLVGGNSSDMLAGGDGDDWLVGGAGPDELDGGANNDVLAGGNGGDTLTGGTDTGTASVALNTTLDVTLTAGDLLCGDGGPDLFVYNKAGTAYDGVDSIVDYEAGDVLQLNGLTAADIDSALAGGNLVIVFKDGLGGYVQNAAIELVGVTDIADVTIEFGII